jgi:menaquinone-dependent protoporphyrinogen oxidase
MKRILVTYATLSGSTAEVADAVAEELAANGLEVDVRPIAEVTSLMGYDGVVIGAPMIMGWHRTALRFLKRHRADFMHMPLAVFVLAMCLTQSRGTGIDDDIPVVVDDVLPRLPSVAEQPTWRERYTRLIHYLPPIVKAVQPAKPVSIGVFGGRLEYGRLPWWAVLFAALIVQAPVGDRRNWPAIRAWAGELPAVLARGAEERVAPNPARMSVPAL